jgi:hypothetical protein
LAALAFAALVAFAPAPAQAGSRSSFSFSFGVSSHDHYRSNWDRHSYGYGHSRWPYSRSHVYVRDYCPPPVIHRPVYYYEPNTAVYVQPQPQTVIVQQPQVISQPAPVIIQQPAAPATTAYTPEPYGIDYNRTATADGWAHLSANQPDLRAAIDAFATEAERFPDRGTPKIGYAITQALTGNEDKAAWAMRQAVLRDPDSLKSVPADGVVANHMRDLVARYENRLADGFSRADDAFMLAALRFMQREYAAANAAITTAQKTGDTDAATFKLADLIAKFNVKS